jgi:hypothetical protein
MSNSPNLKQLIKAVAGAFFGVQSEQQRQLDFNSSSPWPYIMVALCLAAAFIGAVLLVVYWVLS